jgi:hypothetical protein
MKLEILSRQDLRDSIFQDSIIIILCLEKSFKLLIKEKFGLDAQTMVPDKLASSISQEETNFLDSDYLFTLKRNYATHYWKLRKKFLII